jgi:predicted transcriptional regulator
MVTIAERKRIASIVLTTSDEGIIRKIESLIFSEPSKKSTIAKDALLDWNDLPDAIKASVERGLAQSKAGKTTPHTEVMKKYKKWLKK